MLTMMPMAACDGSNADPILPEQPGQPGNSDGGDEDDSTDPTNPIPGGNGRYLVLYCSRTGSTEPYGATDSANTRLRYPGSGTANTL